MAINGVGVYPLSRERQLASVIDTMAFVNAKHLYAESSSFREPSFFSTFRHISANSVTLVCDAPGAASRTHTNTDKQNPILIVCSRLYKLRY
jgi:hypothetical protein